MYPGNHSMPQLIDAHICTLKDISNVTVLYVAPEGYPIASFQMLPWKPICLLADTPHFYRKLNLNPLAKHFDRACPFDCTPLIISVLSHLAVLKPKHDLYFLFIISS